MKRLVMIPALALVATVEAQSPSAKPLGSWVVDYDHAVVRMHGETTQRHEQGRMTLRSVGDSLFGELVMGDSATGDRSALRGVVRKTGWTVYAEDPAARGIGIFFSALGAAMDWLRESVHGVQPVIIRFELVAKGDSLTGTRFVTGGLGPPRQSPVTGQSRRR